MKKIHINIKIYINTFSLNFLIRASDDHDIVMHN